MALEIPVASKFENPQAFRPPSLTQLGSHNLWPIVLLGPIEKTYRRTEEPYTPTKINRHRWTVVDK